ncbi:MAG: hypothetical protein ACLFSQ_04335 [Candidatus Zixiibacteriota bacterium]
MYYMIIHLIQDSRLTEVLMALTEVDAISVQILDSTSASKMFAFDVPIFAGFQEMFGNSEEQSKIILSFVPNADSVDEFIETLKIASIDFIEDGVGDIFLLKLEKALIIDS